MKLIFWWHHLNQKLKSTKRCKSMICGVFLLSKEALFFLKDYDYSKILVNILMVYNKNL